jgi:geranylgeranyl diphosphate synthase type I
VLIALARQALSNGQRRLLDELLGDPELTPQQVDMLQRTIRESGAVDAIEVMIAENVERAIAAVDAAPLAEQARAQLRQLATTVTRRDY